MSVIKTARALSDGQAQVITTAGANYAQATDVQIPLTADGTAVRIAAGGAGTGSTTTVRAAATLTGSYVASTAVDLASYNSATVTYIIGTAQAGQTATVKVEWSEDNTNFWPDPIAVNGAVSGTDVAGTLEYLVQLGSRPATIAMDTTRRKGERFTRAARYIRISAKAGGVTTGTLQVNITPLNN